MNRRITTWLSLALLVAVLVLGLVLRQRSVETEPQPKPPEPEATATEPTPPEEATLVGPTALRDALPAYRACYQRHRVDDPELPAQATIEFSIEHGPDADLAVAHVVEVQLRTGEHDYELMEHDPFEYCVHDVVKDLLFVPPGREGRLRIPIEVNLAEAP
jgi:hypothetical protein